MNYMAAASPSGWAHLKLVEQWVQQLVGLWVDGGSGSDGPSWWVVVGGGAANVAGVVATGGDYSSQGLTALTFTHTAEKMRQGFLVLQINI